MKANHLSWRRVVIPTVITSILSLASSALWSAKPSDVVEWSNGFPSGPHFNLNIHGKKADFDCVSEPGGGSIFVPEYGYAEIQMIQNKKSSITELTVLDDCSFDDGVAKVQLPKGVYQVYARILAKPRKEGEPREVSFSPRLIEACNDLTVYDVNGDTVVDAADLYLIDINGDGFVDANDDPDLNGDGFVDQLDVDIWLNVFGELTDCSDATLLSLGTVSTSGAFSLDGQTLDRGTGKSKAVNVSELFYYEGLIFDTYLDATLDGNLTLDDLLLYDINGDGFVDVNDNYDLNNDTVVDDADFELWLDLLELDGLVLDARLDPIWIFDIADLVVYGWDYNNNGSKLVQVRYYPVDQTEFIVE